ncbi:MAG TPA: phosphate ABC transporter substrate-binding protein PstS, partial [Pirellulales bacterium]
MVLQLGLLALIAGCGPPPVAITGAGATFPYPLYSRWAHSYEGLSAVQINYQSIGSGGGISKIKNQTVDFGASDAPLTAEELEQAGLVQFPLVIGGVVPVVHISGVGPGQLRLTPELLADIFLGDVKSWDDQRIQAANPDLKLPKKDVAVVRRADGSGTTWMFTSYLSAVSPKWKSKVGAEKAVDWPTGWGGKGNEGVAAYVESIDGAIGYVEYAYALQNQMAHVLLKNRSGKFVEPTIQTFQAAAANADWKQSPGFYMVLVDQPGDETWPITGASFILLRKAAADPQKTAVMLKFFDWCYRHGAADAEALHYVPMPSEV